MTSTNSSIYAWLNRAMSIAVLVCLLSSSTPSAPATLVAVAKQSSVSFAFWYHSSGVAKLIQTGIAPRATQETQRDRDLRVSRIQVFPRNVSVDLSDRARFTAVAYDQDGNSLGGVKVRWSGQSATLGQRVRISQRGEFEATAVGTFNVIAEANGRSAQATVVVRPSVRRDLNLSPVGTRQVSTRDVPPVRVGATATPQKFDTTAHSLKVSRHRRSPAAKRAHGLSANASSPVVAPLLPGDGWDDTNYWSADDPGNVVGNPPGAPLDGGAGSGNFQFAAPIYSSSGRGINISLGVAYNSRLWNKAGTQFTYDIDRGWPAPGFNLGFGKMMGMGVNNGAMLVDADGTRHSYTGSITFFSWGTHGVMHTTDGSFIDYEYWTGTGGSMTSGQAKLPNGTVINYGASSGHLYPTSIEDANGNYIVVTYVNNVGPRIQTVTDTVGRVLSFYYDSNNLLTAITAPGLNGGAARTLVRFTYRQLTLNYSFSGVTPAVHDANPSVIEAIYYPGTNTGYWLGDSDSYSTYGMIAKVVEQRGMVFSAPSLNEQGTVTPGQLTRSEEYNYPLSTSDPGGSNLTDAPTYTQMTESWSRDGTNTDSATTYYSATEDSSTRTTIITLPNGTKSKQVSYNAPGQYNDGLVYHDETYVTESTVLQSSTTTWQAGAYDSPRPTRVEKTDENQQLTAAVFSYGTVYNQVTEVRDLDYGGSALLRSTRTSYQNSTNYTDRHIFSLPLTVEVFDPNDNRVSRTEYQYDGQTLTDTPGVVMHDDTYNPYAEQYEQCDCMQWDEYQINCLQWNCYMTSAYNSATDYRGNVTQVTSYANATVEPAIGAVTETRRYDITGNMVMASTACCEQTSLDYTVNTQYAYAESKTRGSATDPYAQIITSATYDFYTGLGKSATDANGRQSTTDYDANTLRPATATLPTGAHTDYAYDDNAMTVTAITYLEAHPTHTTIADQNVKYLNGRGQVRQEQARGPDSGQNQTWDAVDTVFNNLGQVSQQSAAYRIGSETPVLSTALYDALGRTTRVTAPDGSVTETYYNEKDFDTTDSYVPQRPDVASNSTGETTLVRDAWGRERWGRTDASGRLVEVVEPNPNGNGSVATGGLVTTYTYDTLGNLKATHQDVQTRSFKYDSLGRLTAQNLAEMNATLDDSGAYQTSGGNWSDVFSYDERSNLISRTDARGVKTVYNYNSDPLNRLQSVSWDTTGFGDTSNPIIPAGAVTYQYRTKGSPTDPKDITQVETVSTAAVSVTGYSTSGATETYHFDSEGRVDSRTLRFNNRTDYPFATDYTYDVLDRVENVTYPAQYLNGGARKVVHHAYDNSSRLSSLTYDSQSFAANIIYNAASQTTFLNVGSGVNQIEERYNYDSQTGLLSSQTVAKSSTPTTYLLNLEYQYTNASGKRTGQLTKILNNLNHQKDRGYSYDALGRLVQATGGINGALWTQSYAYDRYGNRTSVTASGYSASNRRTSPTTKDGPTEIANADSLGQSSLSHWERGSGEGVAGDASLPSVSLPLPRRSLGEVNESTEPESPSLSAPQAAEPAVNSSPVDRRSHHALRSGAEDARTPRSGTPSPQSGPVFTDDPLTAGVTIKAIHITELRNAINDARAHARLAAASWAEAISSGVMVKASHITEMRARLDEARTALSLSQAAYTDPGLSAGYSIKAVHIQELRQRVTEAINANVAIPRDGHASLSYDVTSNRITTSGFAYDAVGNQTQVARVDGSTEKFQYDAANRLIYVRDGNNNILTTNSYADSNERLIAEESGYRTYYVGEDGATTTEYTEATNSSIPSWSKSYVYLGNRLLSTLTNGSGGEVIQFHHPDRLGTRLVTNPGDGSYFEQQTLPFGTALNESLPSGGTIDSTNRRFTSYDRSSATGLDYAINRHYDSQQGRFTQVDPLGIDAVSFDDPQSLNMYTYCGNDPINQVDPGGLFWGKLWRGIKKILTNKWVVLALTAALLVLSSGALGPLTSKSLVWIAHGALKYPAFVTKLTTLGWITAGIGVALAIPAIDVSLQAYVRNILGFASGAVASTLGAIVRVSGNTPPWNPNAGTGVGAISSFICPKCEEGVAGVIDAVIGPPPIGPFSLGEIARHGICKYVIGRCPDEDTKTYKIAYYSSLIVGSIISGYAEGAALRSLREPMIRGVRIAPFGNSTKHPIGRFPHYHRRVLDATGKTRFGQGIGRHRPWEVRPSDTRWWHRF